MVLHIKKIIPSHTDERGSITDILNNENITHVGRISFKKGSIRGNHYHKQSSQYNYVLSGHIQMTVKNLKEDSDVEVISLKENDLLLLPPFWYHSLKADIDSEIMIFTTKSRNHGGYEDDTYRISDINNFTLD